MNSLEKKIKLLNYENIDIAKDDFYFMILKIEEEKIRLYKPKEREKINYMKEKNYIEHIIKYLKKLNINTNGINKNSINDIEIRTYILNNLTTLALIDDYKDFICYDDEDEDDMNNKRIDNNNSVGEPSNSNVENMRNEIQDDILENFFELKYLNGIDKEEYKKYDKKLNILYEKINEIFKKNDIPLLNSSNISNIISALHLINEKLKNNKKIDNSNYESLFGLNIDVSNNDLKDFAYILKYLFNNMLKKRKKCIKNVLNEIQILTHNPVIDIKQGRVGR
ncbi:conserved Plasmodium protein, unknown function [Plasmodium gallinaceum]|uniref:RNA transcription, translation and transport factor protein n=1 Tax=Plasmodium gallinaceum TaxID=5849 RepID=A0A1J1GY19_PLAGA|nr:conserved Plasmodium protein, unknown function [Plasmodium gallinaceum]CRG96176.1 conserved Plasmodium protein, unknown function [Plasmodium gallinaceum]